MTTTQRLDPGFYEDVTLTLPSAPSGAVLAVADDDGTGRGKVNECNELNNTIGKGITPEIRGTVFEDCDRDGLISGGNEIRLRFDSLPSAQCWKYTTHEPGIPREADVYHVDGTTLIQDTRSIGGRYADYQMAGVVDPTTPFTISIRARVLESEPFQGAAATSFTVGAYTGIESFHFSLDKTRIHAPYGSFTSYPIDATQFHDYRIEAVPGRGFASMSMMFSSSTRRLC